MSTQYLSQTELICDVNALNAEQRDRYQSVIEQLHQSVQEVRELQNGYAFRHAADTPVILSIAEFITLERLCCPFFDFTLEVEREGGHVWLRLTGPEGVKQFLLAELGMEKEKVKPE